MAIWQFSVHFIPRKNLIERFGEIPKLIDEEIIWKENLTESIDLPSNYESFLSKLGAKQVVKWTVKSFNWGDYDYGSHITIDCQDAKSVSVFCRFNVGDLNEDFVKTILEFAKLCESVLFTKNNNIIEPNLDLFIEEVKKSNSYRFCVNPVEFLQSDEVKQIDWHIRKKFSE